LGTICHHLHSIQNFKIVLCEILKVIYSGYGELLPHYGIHFIDLKCIGWGFCVLTTCKYKIVVFLEKLKTNDVHYGFLNR
jgi:hypothetical protein